MNKTAIRPSRAPAVAIIGGGLIGLAIAWRLARRGHRVTVYEEATPGAGASRAAAGMLSVVAEAEPPDPSFFELCRESRRRWPAFAAELEAATGQELDLREEGTLLVARTESDEAMLAHLATAHRGDGTLLALDRKDWRRLEPGLAADTRAVYLAPEDGAVDNRAAIDALAQAVLRAGGELKASAHVTRIAHETGRVIGIERSGDREHADVVVIAAGIGTSHILSASGLGDLAAPIAPVKGQLIALQDDAQRPVIRQVVRGERAYLVPRSSGRLIVGATSEPGIGDLELTAAARDALFAAGVELVPALAALPIIDHWSGLRPHLAGGLPMIGAAGPQGLIAAIGHYRNGVLLTPITADLVAGLITGELDASERALLEAFSPARLSASARADKGAAARTL